MIVKATTLTTSEWGGCIVIGSTPLLISALLKLSPESWLAKVKLDKFIDESKDMSSNAILDKYEKGSKMKIDAVDKLVKRADGKGKGGNPMGDDNDYQAV